MPCAVQTGAYYRPDEAGDAITSLNPLEGILSHIHHVKDAVETRDHLERVKNPTAFRKLYARFLSYRYFVRLEQPLIICEGKTDNVYLKYAIRSLMAFHPRLGAWSGSQFESAVTFFSYANQAHKVLQLSGGTGHLKHLILNYNATVRRFQNRPLSHPVILLIDNDSGAKEIFGVIKEKFKITIDLNSNDKFYHLIDNLYLVKTIESGGGQPSCIENLFDPALLKTDLKGKKFNPAKEFASDGEYGKHVFAEAVVRPNAETIDFPASRRSSSGWLPSWTTISRPRLLVRRLTVDAV